MPASKAITSNDVWKTIHALSQEIREMGQRLEKAFEETGLMFKETGLKFQETDRMFKETDLKFQQTDQEFEKTKKILEASSLKVDREIEKNSRESRRASGELKEAMGRLTNKWGMLVEAIIAPGTVKLFKKRGIAVEGMAQRISKHHKGENMEIDILLHNGDSLVVVEVKTDLSVDDVKDFLSTLSRFKRFFPEYADKKILGAVAALRFSGESDRFAYKNGLFSITQSGENIRILNDMKFKPLSW